METIPKTCININTVRSFCDCIGNDASVDAAARGFCDRVQSGRATDVTGDDLAELKKALMDLES